MKQNRLEWAQGRPDDEIAMIGRAYSHYRYYEYKGHLDSIRFTMRITGYDESSVRLAVYESANDKVLDKFVWMD